MYLLAVLFPPAAVLVCGKPVQALIAFLLMFVFFFPGVIYACLVVHEYKANERNDKLINALKGSRRRSTRREEPEEEEPTSSDNPFAF